MRIPARLAALTRYEGGAAWLSRLPALVSGLEDDWSLELGEPFLDSTVSFVAPARRGGDRLVLKVQWPHRESMKEAEALKVWDGGGAVRLVAHDADRSALLLEHCLPGEHLAACEIEDPLSVLVDLLPRLWKPVGFNFRSLADEAAGWRSQLVADWESAGRPFGRDLVDAAAGFLDDLSGSQSEQGLLHQDLHGENVLSAEREPWLVIDPKPLVGEREFSLAPIIRSFEFGHSRDQVIGRLDRLSTELGLDRQRCRGWAIAQTVAWAFDSDHTGRHAETAQWLLEAA